MLVLALKPGEEVYIDGGRERVIVGSIQHGWAFFTVETGDRVAIASALKQHGRQMLLAGKVEMRVLAVERDRVRLGFNADRSIVIDREVVHLMRKEARWKPTTTATVQNHSKENTPAKQGGLSSGETAACRGPG